MSGSSCSKAAGKPADTLNWYVPVVGLGRERKYFACRGCEFQTRLACSEQPSNGGLKTVSVGSEHCMISVEDHHVNVVLQALKVSMHMQLLCAVTASERE